MPHFVKRIFFIFSNNVHQKSRHYDLLYAFYFMGSVNFVSNVCGFYFFNLVPRKSETNLLLNFRIRQGFQCTFLCWHQLWFHFLSYFLTDKGIDIESDHLGSNPNTNCSSNLELWASSLASLSLSFLSVINEDNIGLTIYVWYEVINEIKQSNT